MHAPRPFIVLATAALFVSQARADVFGIDARPVFFSPDAELFGADYDQFRAKFKALGHTIVPITDFADGSLDGLDALVFRQRLSLGDPITTAEVDAIHAFVLNGGGLIAIAEAGFSSNSTVEPFNSVVAPFGVQASLATSDPNGYVESELITHPVTEGVDAFGMDFLREFLFVTAPTIELSLSQRSVVASRTGSGGSGNAVFFADSSQWNDDDSTSDFSFSALDNEALLEGAIEFALAAPTEVTALCIPRNGTGVNPSGFDCVGRPVVGSTWQAEVEVGPQTIATLIALSRGSSVARPSPFFGELLLPTDPPFLVDWSLGAHAIAITPSPSLVGFPCTSQGARLEPGPGGVATVLQNAQDLVLGDG